MVIRAKTIQLILLIKTKNPLEHWVVLFETELELSHKKWSEINVKVVHPGRGEVELDCPDPVESVDGEEPEQEDEDGHHDRAGAVLHRGGGVPADIANSCGHVPGYFVSF